MGCTFEFQVTQKNPRQFLAISNEFVEGQMNIVGGTHAHRRGRDISVCALEELQWGHCSSTQSFTFGDTSLRRVAEEATLCEGVKSPHISKNDWNTTVIGLNAVTGARNNS